MRFLVPCALAKRANTRHNSSAKTIQKIDLWHCKRHFSTAPAHQDRNGNRQICADFCAVWFCFVFLFPSCFCACHRIDFVAQPLRKSSFLSGYLRLEVLLIAKRFVACLVFLIFFGTIAFYAQKLVVRVLS